MGCKVLAPGGSGRNQVSAWRWGGSSSKFMGNCTILPRNTHELPSLSVHSNYPPCREDIARLGYRTFRCSQCRRKFNERTRTLYNHLQYPTDIVLLVVLWRLRYKLSLRDVAEMFLERGFEFTHEAGRDWEGRFAPLITSSHSNYVPSVGAKPGNHGIATRLMCYVRVSGKWCYLYRHSIEMATWSIRCSWSTEIWSPPRGSSWEPRKLSAISRHG